MAQMMFSDVQNRWLFITLILAAFEKKTPKRTSDRIKDSGRPVSKGKGTDPGLHVPPPIRSKSPDEKIRPRSNIAGFLKLVTVVVILLAGIIGYLKYDEYVEPNLPVYVCCLPSAIVALALIFWGSQSGRTQVRQGNYRPTRPVHREGSKTDIDQVDEFRKGAHKTSNNKGHGAKKIHRRELVMPVNEHSVEEGKPFSQLGSAEREEKREKLQAFIYSLKEQYKEGLLMEETYQMLSNKYKRELSELEKKERIITSEEKTKK
jgi:hypothetical protein